MQMPSYPIYCYTKGCKNLASYKIAGRWSDGVQSELKTYCLCCADCLPACFQESLQKQRSCRLAQGESLESPGIYQLQHGQRDRRLQRLVDLEATLGRT
jgi:hypothetical protein